MASSHAPDPDDLDFGATLRGFAAGQTVLKRYKLTRLIGRGGMGVVWEAMDTELEETVALKFLPETLVADSAAIDDLKREVRRSRQLAHPNVVRIHGFETDGTTAAISMEVVHGQTLTAVRVARKARVVTVAELELWVRQICGALDYAHQKAKVVHRDLKPANVMATTEGDVKILDFGIAASISESASRVSNRGTSGTLTYMSPQQLLGKMATPADDFYALGATLYELLTGKPPFFQGAEETQVLNVVPNTLAKRRGELGVVGEEIPAAWEITIAALLAKEPEDRPQSGAALLAMLSGEKTEGLKGGKAEIVSGDPKQNTQAKLSHSKKPLWLMAVALLTLSALGYYFGKVAPEQRSRLAETTNPVSPVEPERLRSEKADAGTPVIIERDHISVPKIGEKWTIPDMNLTMVPIAPGTFMMGSNDEQDYKAKPAHQVTLRKPYWLGQYEVTQAEYQAIMGTNPSQFTKSGATAPVETVSYLEAQEFCRKLTVRERQAKRLPVGYEYALPTEAQWEYACRAGSTGAYAGNLSAMAWYGSIFGGTHTVGEKQPNDWGLYDMHGNVWEWCSDWHGEYNSGSQVDPASTAMGSFRINRGGSWSDTERYCRSAYRYWDEPGYRSNNVGFRLALAPSSR